MTLLDPGIKTIQFNLVQGNVMGPFCAEVTLQANEILTGHGAISAITTRTDYYPGNPNPDDENDPVQMAQKALNKLLESPTSLEHAGVIEEGEVGIIFYKRLGEHGPEDHWANVYYPRGGELMVLDGKYHENIPYTQLPKVLGTEVTLAKTSDLPEQFRK